VTYLLADLSLTATTIQCAIPEGGLGIGMVEVGDELMQVISVDEDASQLNLLPQGRGWRGTTASTHAAGDTVVVSPLVPRWRVKKAINDTLVALWAQGVYGVGTTEFVFSNPTALAYEVPAEAESILAVRYRDLLGNWVKVRAWEVVRSSNTTDFASGVSLRISEALLPGCTVQVVYGKRPTGLSTGSAPLTDSGLPVSAKDLLVLGAQARLIPAMDAGRLSVQYVPADELDQPRQLGSAVALAREFNAQYQAALVAERQSLQNQYPAPIHFTTSR
jgi:hypothetical protein